MLTLNRERYDMKKGMTGPQTPSIVAPVGGDADRIIC